MENGRNIYLTQKEQQALRETASEWCDIMCGGNAEACDCVEERLNEGLGSALRKLYKGLNGERLYTGYKTV